MYLVSVCAEAFRLDYVIPFYNIPTKMYSIQVPFIHLHKRCFDILNWHFSVKYQHLDTNLD